MGKLVVAIAVVFCLDLAFILFLQGGGDLVDLSRAMNVPFDPIVISQELEIPEAASLKTPDKDIYDVHDPIIDRVYQGNLRTAAPSRIQSSRKREIARKIVTSPLRSYVSEVPAETFTDTVIWIERTSFVSDRQDERVRAGQDRGEVPTAAKKKRSFFSRVRPLVTKPYDWARTFASKLF